MIQINLPSEIEEKLRERAAEAGQDLNAVIVEALREKFEQSTRLDSILAPFRAAFTQSGSSEADLDQAIESARHDVWKAKQRP